MTYSMVSLTAFDLMTVVYALNGILYGFFQSHLGSEIKRINAFLINKYAYGRAALQKFKF